MNKLEKIKNYYKNETDRKDIILWNIIYYLWKHNYVKIDPLDEKNDILYIYDNLYFNNEIIDKENLENYTNYLKEIKGYRLNYYIKEIKEKNKIILLNFYSSSELKNCFIKLENKDYWNIKG